MAEKSKSSRRQRREIIARFEKHYDFERLDYDRRVAPLRGKAKLNGVMVAGFVYISAFMAGYFAWSSGKVEYELFGKLVWILMVPSSVVGIFAWLLSSNRREYEVRQDVRDCLSKSEANGGFLWRFTPLQEAMAADDYLSKKIMQQTRETGSDIDPGDYGQVVSDFYKRLLDMSPAEFNQNILARVMENLNADSVVSSNNGLQNDIASDDSEESDVEISKASA